MKNHWVQLLIGATALLACAPMGANGGDSGVTVDSPPAVCATPRGPYGNLVGQTVTNYNLQTCDGVDYEFLGPDSCNAPVTYVIAAAGW